MAATPKHFHQTLKCAVDAFRATLVSCALHVGNLGDFLRQRVVPELPAELLGKLAGDFSAAASVFPFDCDDAIHQHSRLTFILPRLWVLRTFPDAKRAPGSRRDRR